MKLEKVIDGILYEVVQGDINKDIKSLCYDSRKVAKDTLFVCLTGFQTDGHDYIDSAIEKGATAILVEKDVKVKDKNITVIKVMNTRTVLSHISSNFFDNPTKKIKVVGVTGTKGKTTTTHMCKSIMEAAGVKTGMIGTLGAYIGNEHIETKNTTPESYELQELFSKMVKKGCEVVFIEVSSQAVKMHRIDGIRFEIGAFTNLSPDHISPTEHADFDEYKFYKKEFFRQVETAVINLDDEYSLDSEFM